MQATLMLRCSNLGVYIPSTDFAVILWTCQTTHAMMTGEERLEPAMVSCSLLAPQVSSESWCSQCFWPFNLIQLCRSGYMTFISSRVQEFKSPRVSMIVPN